MILKNRPPPLITGFFSIYGLLYQFPIHYPPVGLPHQALQTNTFPVSRKKKVISTNSLVLFGDGFRVIHSIYRAHYEAIFYLKIFLFQSYFIKILSTHFNSMLHFYTP